MTGNVIDRSLHHGYPGTPSHTPDEIIAAHPVDGGEANGILFGDPVVINSDGKVKKFGADGTAATFAGVAARVVKTPTAYPNQSMGSYFPGDMAGIIERGAVSVQVDAGITGGNIAIGGTPYIRIAANAANPNAVIGGFESVADGSNTIALTNAKFSATADANGVAEITILTRQAV